MFGGRGACVGANHARDERQLRRESLTPVLLHGRLN